MTSQQENVLRKVSEQDIGFIRLWFTDIFGSLKTIMMSPAELEAAFDEGVGFDTGSVPQIRLGLRGSILGRMKAVPGGTAEITSRPGHGTTVRIGWTP